MLHITNGDCAAAVLRGARVPGDILPWVDVLHEGPVDASRSLEALSEARIRFIAGAGWAPEAEVRRRFRDRDERLARSKGDDEVVLWFEHDLYDQLQLIQLLDWFSSHPHSRLSLICEPEYLGRMAPGRAAQLFAQRSLVGKAQLDGGRSAWKAFGSSDPSSISLDRREGLPFLAPALRRMLQEYPWTADGLSRLERAVLGALEAGPRPFAELSAAVSEDPIWLGDTTLEWHLRRMAEEGLVEKGGDAWSLKAMQRGRRVPRWIGGVLVDDACAWRWDDAACHVSRKR